MVADGRDVEPDLLAQVEVEEGQGWCHVLFFEPGGGISSSYMSGAESKRQKWAKQGRYGAGAGAGLGQVKEERVLQLHLLL